MAVGQCPEQYMDEVIDGFILHKDIYFGENTSENGVQTTLLLDIFEPAFVADQTRPLVIMIHGGSFTGGSKETGEVAWFCEDLARRGVLAASINYRVESDPLALISEEKMIKAVRPLDKYGI